MSPLSYDTLKYSKLASKKFESIFWFFISWSLFSSSIILFGTLMLVIWTRDPDSSNASKDLHFFYVKRIQDADATYTDATDVPYRFVPCMASGLAFYLAQKFNPQIVQQMKLLYEDELARALAEDGSAASTYITPKNYYPNIWH